MDRREQRIWKLLLLIHLICYEAFFIIALSSFNSVWYASQNNFIILLFWTPLLLLHVGATYYYSGRGDIHQLERSAYREGYADAMRQFSERTTDDMARLTVDDEGELVEVPKRKRMGD